MRSRTEFYEFSGKGSWFKIVNPDSEYNCWSVKLHFDEKSLELFRWLQQKHGEVEGILNEVKEDVDGPYHVFKRPTVRDFGKGLEQLLPPMLLDDKGDPWDKKVGIGNGTDISLKVECYQYSNRRTKKVGRAIRLVEVKILNLVPYTRKDFTPEQEEMLGKDKKVVTSAPRAW